MAEPQSPYVRLDQSDKPSRGGFRHAVASTQAETFAVDVEAGPFAWTLDEPQSLGGRGTAPDPVTSFLGALCGCLSISIQMSARARHVPLAGMQISARTNEKGYVKTVEVDLTVRSPAAEEHVRTIVERAERGCYIKALLKDTIDYRLRLTVEPA